MYFLKHNKLLTLAIIMVSFPCFVNSDQTNPNLQNPIPPSRHSLAQLTVSDTKPRLAELPERFKNACSNENAHSRNIECPFEEKNVCRGEGCFEEGIVEAIKPFPLFQNPYSGQAIATAQIGEPLVFSQTLAFSVPCFGVVVNSSATNHPEYQSDNSVHRGDVVHRLGYAGEGTYRYLVDGKLMSSAVGDTVEYIDGCVQQEELWLHLRDSTGLVGWGLADYKSMNGLSIHDAHLSRPPPEWVKGFISESRYTRYSK